MDISSLVDKPIIAFIEPSTLLAVQVYFKSTASNVSISRECWVQTMPSSSLITILESWLFLEIVQNSLTNSGLWSGNILQHWTNGEGFPIFVLLWSGAFIYCALVNGLSSWNFLIETIEYALDFKLMIRLVSIPLFKWMHAMWVCDVQSVAEHFSIFVKKL